MDQKGISSIVIILIIVGVLVAAGGGVYLYHRYFFGSNQIPEVKLLDKWQVCELDSDCIETQSSCCACSSGGTSTGINKEYLENWETKLKQDCKDIGCIALFNCKQGKTICQNNKCEFVIQEDETADWKTYRNEEFGFEVKYPPESQVNQFNWYSGKVAGNLLRGAISILSSRKELDAVIFNNPQKLSLKDWVNQNFLPSLSIVLKEEGYNVVTPEYRETEIGNYFALISDIGASVLFPRIFIISPLGDSIVFFQDGFGLGISGFGENEFNKIVTSFKFIK